MLKLEVTVKLLKNNIINKNTKTIIIFFHQCTILVQFDKNTNSNNYLDFYLTRALK